MSDVPIRKRVLFLCFALIFLTFSFSGCLGIHDECSECGGDGIVERQQTNPFEFTPLLTKCDECDGDGEVGIFIENELIEDILSVIFLIAIIIAPVILVAFWNRRRMILMAPYVHQTYQQSQYPYPSYQQSQYFQQFHYAQPEYQKPIQQHQFMYCTYCGKEIVNGSNFCTYCGGKLSNVFAPSTVNNGASDEQKEPPKNI
jgi:hypothetical protein